MVKQAIPYFSTQTGNARFLRDVSRVQLDAEKKIECLCKLQTPGKKQRHTIRKFVFRENNFYQQIDSSVTVYFAVNCQTKVEKSVCFLITFLSG